MVAINLPIWVWRGRVLLFSFRGRVSRRLVWYALWIYFAYGAITGGVIQAATLENGTSPRAFWVLLAVLDALPIAVSASAMGTKRLHDRGKSAWWLIGFYLVPAALVATPYIAAIPLGAFALPLTAIGIWAFVELCCLAGTPGPNRYGPDFSAAP